MSRAGIVIAALAIVIASSAYTGGSETGSPDASTESAAGSDTSAEGKTDTAKKSAESPPGSASSDRSALIAVLDALNARPGWADGAHQTLNEVPAEERIGIFTDENGRVVGLLLSNRLLSGELPPRSRKPSRPPVAGHGRQPDFGRTAS